MNLEVPVLTQMPQCCMSFKIVFIRPAGTTSTTDEEERQATTRAVNAVFPLPTPLIAGPGAMGATILPMTEMQGDLTL